MNFNISYKDNSIVESYKCIFWGDCAVTKDSLVKLYPYGCFTKNVVSVSFMSLYGKIGKNLLYPSGNIDPYGFCVTNSIVFFDVNGNFYYVLPHLNKDNSDSTGVDIYKTKDNLAFVYDKTVTVNGIFPCYVVDLGLMAKMAFISNKGVGYITKDGFRLVKTLQGRSFRDIYLYSASQGLAKFVLIDELDRLQFVDIRDSVIEVKNILDISTVSVTDIGRVVTILPSFTQDFMLILSICNDSEKGFLLRWDDDNVSLEEIGLSGDFSFLKNGAFYNLRGMVKDGKGILFIFYKGKFNLTGFSLAVLEYDIDNKVLSLKLFEKINSFDLPNSFLPLSKDLDKFYLIGDNVSYLEIRKMSDGSYRYWFNDLIVDVPIEFVGVDMAGNIWCFADKEIFLLPKKKSQYYLELKYDKDNHKLLVSVYDEDFNRVAKTVRLLLLNDIATFSDNSSNEIEVNTSTTSDVSVSLTLADENGAILVYGEVK